MAQLANREEDVNQRQLLTQIFRKFSQPIQLKILEKKSELENPKLWDWKRFHTVVDDIISKKELIEEAQITGSYTVDYRSNSEANAPSNRNRRPYTAPECLYCKQTTHRSIECTSVPMPQRAAFFNRNKLCKNCGRPDHRVDTCSKRGCRLCGQKHHTSLHNPGVEGHAAPTAVQSRQSRDTTHWQTGSALSNQRRTAPQNFVSRQTEDGEDTVPAEDSQAIMEINEQSPPRAQLLTGSAEVVGPTQSMKAAILLDTGSELSFIHSSIADQLQLPCVGKETLRLTTFGSSEVKEKTCDIVFVKLKDDQGKLLSFTLFKADVITNYISAPQFSKDDLKFIDQQGIQLPNEVLVTNPTILLGCDQLWTVMKNNIRKLPSGLHLISTSFGYMTSGKQTRPSYKSDVLLTTTKDEERAQWEQFLTFESSGVDEYSGPHHMEKKEVNDRVMKRFNETIVKNSDGYYVRLPWKDDHEQLPDNRYIAEARLQGLFRAYRDNPQFLQEYDQIFKDQLAKGILERVIERHGQHSGIVHYLPHHAVVTPEKRTTPKRIVFDASAHYRNKPSLNDVLHQGPLILPKLTGMLLRFRTGKIALASDVEKAFLQVRLHEEDRNATRCLWVKDITKPPTEDNILVYRFTRVTFGINASPFLLSATIRFHLNTHTEDPALVDEIDANLYVDNLFVSAESTSEALEKYKATKKIFGELNMNLREFMSNDSDLIARISPEDRSINETPKILGVRWNSKDDTLSIDNCPLKTTRTTKRAILSALASVYDPMGWLTPLMLRTKQFFQYLWSKDYDWDTMLTPDDIRKWNAILIETKGFSKDLPRRVADKMGSHTLALFADASTTAMCAVVYLCHNQDAHLLMAKSRLPKIKEKITVPKMEMNALTMAARLSRSTFDELRKSITINSIIVFSDSQIALHWLKKAEPEKEVGRLVHNRLREIKAIAKDLREKGIEMEFGYISTEDNPADIGTRGTTAEEFQQSIWWKGPAQLRQPTELWPPANRTFLLCQGENDEVNQHILAVQQSESSESVFDVARFSTLDKLEATAAYVLRFIANTSKGLLLQRRHSLQTTMPEITNQEGTEPLKASNLQQARKFIWKLHQTQFKKAILTSSNNKLNIKKDCDGIYRCYGRLGKSLLSKEAQLPVILAPDTDFAKLVIRKAHGQYHCSVSHTMANVRQQFWIPRLRKQVKMAIRRCIPCQKFNNLPFRYPNVEDLPTRRVVQTRPFNHIGLDMFGPLHLKGNRDASDTTAKTYGAIFTCATTRLIHLELLPDASTSSFLNALRRFIARRGSPESITCDNAPSFKLGQDILAQANQ